MKNLKERTERYLSRMSKSEISLTRVRLNKLPLVMRERFTLFRTSIFGREWLFAIEFEDWDIGTPSEYRDQSHKLAAAAEKPVVLVLSGISAAVRNRMTQMNVPFVVPESQVFLPVSLINLQETCPRRAFSKGKKLSPTAQALLLYHIIRGGLELLSSKQIAGKLGYSEMTISKARSELEANQLCEVSRQGKELQLRFIFAPSELWIQAQSLLRSPVQKRHWVHWDQPEASARLAGISALSQRSNLADDKIHTFALKKQNFRLLMEQGKFHECEDRHEANARIESWSYDPTLLSDENAVDPLSLYLSLRDNPDERVQSELESMMDKFQWR